MSVTRRAFLRGLASASALVASGAAFVKSHTPDLIADMIGVMRANNVRPMPDGNYVVVAHPETLRWMREEGIEFNGCNVIESRRIEDEEGESVFVGSSAGPIFTSGDLA